LNAHQIEIDGIVVEVVRKDVKHLRMAVYPPDGRVRVSVPLRADDEIVRQVIASRRAWILRKQNEARKQILSFKPKFVSGERHLFQGVPYTLELVKSKGPERVVLCSNHIIKLHANPRSTITRRGKIVTEWYRKQLKHSVPPLIRKWEKVMGVEVAEWGVKKMRTRWGSCNSRARRIWLNLELAKKPSECLEYVVVHEMVHLLERGHGRRFKELMSQFLPQWRSIRRKLKYTP
jgi:predicted metal-dependent hydrolase